ncbi:MAG: hypothetical protein NTW49_04010 [Bacteroidia bacterium]|nr:hypothetical protein [Bacteroidia bacterium]
MNTLIVSTKNKEELKLVTDLLKKMHIVNKELTAEELEDSGLLILMKQADRSQKVSREKVMAKLGRK